MTARRVPESPSRRTGSARSTGRAAQAIVSAPSSATFVAHSVRSGAISSAASSPTLTAKTIRSRCARGVVFGSVSMKKRKTSTSGEVRSDHQKYGPVIGPRCQRAVIVCPVAASTAIPAANASQKPSAIQSNFSRDRMRRPPLTITTNASRSHGETGPHQKSSGSTRVRPSTRKQRTSPMLDGLKTCEPRRVITYFESSDTAAVPMKIHQPRRLHQSPW